MKSKSILYQLVSVFLIAFIYWLLFNEFSVLFAINTILTILLVCLLFRSSASLTIKKETDNGIVLSNYASIVLCILAVLWCWLYSFFLFKYDKPIEILFIGIAIIAIIAIVSKGVIEFSAHGIEELNLENITDLNKKQQYSYRLVDVKQKLYYCTKDYDVQNNADIQKKIRTIISRLQTIPTRKIDSNTDEFEMILTELDNIPSIVKTENVEISSILQSIDNKIIKLKNT